MIYALAALACAAALSTVFTRRLLHSAVFLMAVLSLTAVFYLALGADFLAGVQILVYVGGIVVLLVFAVMLTHSEDLLTDQPTWGRRLCGLAAAASFFAVGARTVSRTSWPVDVDGTGTAAATGVREIGRALLDVGPGGYVLPFEVVSLLLLAVLIGGLVLARPDRKGEG